jgi:hypothetical protein
MRPRDLKILLTEAIKRSLAILITGEPGIGKTDIVAEAAADTDADLIVSHPVVADPTDAKGLPWPAPKGDGEVQEATFLPFGDLAAALKATKPTVWFLDDLGQASPAVQASFMQLILARRINGHALPDCVTFMAATNLRTHKAGVGGILEPVKSRFNSIVNLEVNLDDSCDWFLDHGYPSELVGFLRFKPSLLNDFKPTADMTNSPSPRTWAHASKFIHLGLPPSVELAALQGAVGEGAGVEFSSFLRVYREMPSLDEILLSPKTAIWPSMSNPSARYAVAAGLATKANPTNFARVAEYMDRMCADSGEEFAVLLARDAVRRDANIAHCPAFQKLMVGNLGRLILGTDEPSATPSKGKRK